MNFFISWFNLNLQNRNSPIIEQLIFFHDYSLVILIVVISLVGYLINLLLFNLFINKYFLSGQIIEIIWTVFPAVILLFIAFPSLQLLYLLDEINDPLITLKAVGHQWYWQYEYLNFLNLEFDSYITKYEYSKFRLLITDNAIVIPKESQIRFLASSYDVIHSWTIPRLGVKIDASPGRLNQTNFFINRVGLFFGQCSEICGANHSFIPIILEGTTLNKFLKEAPFF